MASDTPVMATMVPFGGNFTIRNWALCQGALLPISEYAALYSLLGTYYGGDGRTTVGLPDLRGRSPVGEGVSPIFGNFPLGAQMGHNQVTLDVSQMPPHTHTSTFTPQQQPLSASFEVATNTASATAPASGSYLGAAPNNPIYFTPGFQQPSLTNIQGLTVDGGEVSGEVDIGITGSGVAINITNPLLAMNWLIAIEGLYPSRN